ncbi:hypothetical protein ACIHFE_17410 [Streptomyces sp. NPDC052396]|uniref:hypothetical protein n=1 Tax=Streptomyces sp. NPDC052396 TaxID=3365689 RepID=UPI0037CD37C3
MKPDAVEIRRGGVADIPAILALLDAAVLWLNAQGALLSHAVAETRRQGFTPTERVLVRESPVQVLERRV